MTTIPASEDSVKVDPKHYKVEFQNDRVRVLRIKYGPKEKSVMHSHPASARANTTMQHAASESGRMAQKRGLCVRFTPKG